MLSAETESVEISSSNDNQYKNNQQYNMYEHQEFQLSVNPPIQEQIGPIKSQRYRQALFQDRMYQKTEFYENEPPITEDKSGYSNLRDTINQDETIFEAFKAIDINKDSFISKSDLKTFLQYINEPYLEEELDQMIRMFDPEGKNKVSIQVFKQFAKGEIIGLCNSFIPNQEMKSNQKIFKNMMQFSDVDSFQSQQFKRSINKGLTGSSKKMGSTKQIDFRSKIIPRSQKRILNQNYYKQRRDEIRKYVHISLQILLHQFSIYENKMLCFNQIMTIFGLDEQVALKLYQKQKLVSSRQLFIEYLTSTTASTLEKIQKSINIFTKKAALTMDQVSHFLQILIPYQSSQVWQKRLRSLLTKKQVDISKPISKQIIINLLLQYRMIFRF